MTAKVQEGLMLLNAGYSEPGPRWNWKDVYSPFARIYYVTAGNARTIINGIPFDLEPGNIYLTPPFTMHDDESHGEFSLYYIHFYENSTGEGVFNKYDFPVFARAKEYDRLLIERLLEINPQRHLEHIDPKVYDTDPEFAKNIAYHKTMPVHTGMETSGILEILLSRFLKKSVFKMADKDLRIVKAIKYIHENTHSVITISELAESLCLSPDHFTRLFRRETGLSPVVYVNRKKIEKAQLLLLTTDMPVKDIATCLSVDNVPYFNKLFRSLTGSTPGNYRARAENDEEVKSQVSFYSNINKDLG